MELPHSKTRQTYIEQVRIVEVNLKSATNDEIDHALLAQVQKRLDTLADKYQYSKEIGTARYKLYELQALVHFFTGNDAAALDFINQAIEIRGDSYARAEKLKAQLRRATSATRASGSDRLPLELQHKLNNARSFAVFFASAYAVLALFTLGLLVTNNGSQDAPGYLILQVIMSVLYIICAKKLSKDYPPLSRGWAITAAILTILSAPSIVGIFIDIELWRSVGSIKKYSKSGTKAFMSDEEWHKRHKKTWSSRRQVVTAIIVGIIAGVMVCGFNLLRSTSQVSSPAVKEAYNKMESLRSKYDSCSGNLDARRDNVDTSNSYEVNSFNSDLKNCESTRLELNRAVDEYNNLAGFKE